MHRLAEGSPRRAFLALRKKNRYRVREYIIMDGMRRGGVWRSISTETSINMSINMSIRGTVIIQTR
jgi:hypothetical protein